MLLLKKDLPDQSVDTDILGITQKEKRFQRVACKQQNMMRCKGGDIRVTIKTVEG